MAQNETWINHDLMSAVKVQYLDGNVFSQDNAGNLIGVHLTRDGADYSGGGSVSASVIRADGATVAVSGALSGADATVVLPSAAYAVPGVISVVVKLSENGEVTTIAAIVANVYQSSTDTTVDPGTIIPSIDDLIDAIEAAVATIPADYSALWASVAPVFSASNSYKAGQIVSYNGKVYQFYFDHSGSWNATDVVEIADGDAIYNLYRATVSTNAFDSLMGYQKITIPSSAYNATWFYYEFKIKGFNSEIVICANGGTLYERVNNANQLRISDAPTIITGEHTYRVYTKDTSNAPYYLIKYGTWCIGYSGYDNPMTWVYNKSRCTQFIDVKAPVDIDADAGTLFDTLVYTSGNWVNLDTRSISHYTLNPGYYAVVAMNTSTSTDVTETTLNGLHISPVVFPKVTGFPYYETLKYTKPGAGAQGICCDENNVYVFNGLGHVFKFDFDGDFVEDITIASDSHCNSATYYNGNYYTVDQGDSATVEKYNASFEIVSTTTIAKLHNLAYGDDGYFYGLKVNSTSGNIATGIDLYRFDSNLSNGTLLKSGIIPDGKYVVQGIEVQNEHIILVLFTQTNNVWQGIIAYYTKAGNLVKWKYAQLHEELEDVAVNKSGDMFVSYQGNSEAGLPLFLAKSENVTRYNATDQARNVVSGVSVGFVKDPLFIYADEDHAVLKGKITGLSGQTNVARVSANVVPHVILKYYNDGFVATSGTTGRNNDFFPLFSIAQGSDTEITFIDFYISLKNNRWFTDSL